MAYLANKKKTGPAQGFSSAELDTLGLGNKTRAWGAQNRGGSGGAAGAFQRAGTNAADRNNMAAVINGGGRSVNAGGNPLDELGRSLGVDMGAINYGQQGAAQGEPDGGSSVVPIYSFEDVERLARSGGVYDQVSPDDWALARANPTAGMGIIEGKINYAKATTDEQRALINQGVNSIRQSYGGYTAGGNGYSVGSYGGTTGSGPRGEYTLQNVVDAARRAGVYDSISDQDWALAMADPAAGMNIVNAKIGWAGAQTDEQRALYNQQAEQVRLDKGYYGGRNGSGYYKQINIPENPSYDDFYREAQAAGLLETFGDYDLRLAQTNPELGLRLLQNKLIWHSTDDPKIKKMANDNNEYIRQYYGGYTGGTSGNAYTKQGAPQDATETGKGLDYHWDEIDDQKSSLRQQQLDMYNQGFDWDPETDRLYQAARLQHLREADRAAEDTLGRYAANTGGIAGSAAIAAASQAADYHKAQLNDELNRYYQQAYNEWLQKYGMGQQNLDMLINADDTAYGRAADEYTRENAEDHYADELARFEKEFAEGQRQYDEGVGRQIAAENRAQAEADRADARERLAMMLTAGVAVEDLPPELVEISGLTAADLNSMRAISYKEPEQYDNNITAVAALSGNTPEEVSAAYAAGYRWNPDVGWYYTGASYSPGGGAGGGSSGGPSGRSGGRSGGGSGSGNAATYAAAMGTSGSSGSSSGGSSSSGKGGSTTTVSASQKAAAEINQKYGKSSLGYDSRTISAELASRNLTSAQKNEVLNYLKNGYGWKPERG